MGAVGPYLSTLHFEKNRVEFDPLAWWWGDNDTGMRLARHFFLSVTTIVGVREKFAHECLEVVDDAALKCSGPLLGDGLVDEAVAKVLRYDPTAVHLEDCRTGRR